MARDPALVAFYAFTAAAAAGWAVALGGFAALQAGCSTNPEWMARQGAFAGNSCARWNAEVSPAASSSRQSKQKTANQPTNRSPTTAAMQIEGHRRQL